MRVMLMLCQPFGKLSFMMIEDIGQISYAVRRLGLLQTVVFQFPPQHVPDGFRTIGVPASTNQAVEFRRQMLV